MLVAPWGDLPAVERAFRENAGEIAAVIMEPVNYNSGCLVADPGYMEAVRDLTRDGGAVLIYDEILSGFRTGVDCTQGYYGVTPDVTLLGKAVANGVPLAVVAGRREIMETFSPLGSARAQRDIFRSYLWAIGGACHARRAGVARVLPTGQTAYSRPPTAFTAGCGKSSNGTRSGAACKDSARDSASISGWIRRRNRGSTRTWPATIPMVSRSSSPRATSGESISTLTTWRSATTGSAHPMARREIDEALNRIDAACSQHVTPL